MLRAHKAQVIDELSTVFGETGAVVVTHYKGLTVAEVSDLRHDARRRSGVPRDQEQAGAARLTARRSHACHPCSRGRPRSRTPRIRRRGEDRHRVRQEERQAADRRRPRRHAARCCLGPGAGGAAVARRVARQADRPAQRPSQRALSVCCRRRAARSPGAGGTIRAAGRLSADRMWRRSGRPAP